MAFYLVDDYVSLSEISAGSCQGELWINLPAAPEM